MKKQIKTAKIVCIRMWPQMHILDVQGLYVFWTTGLTTAWKSLGVILSIAGVAHGKASLSVCNTAKQQQCTWSHTVKAGSQYCCFDQTSLHTYVHLPGGYSPLSTSGTGVKHCKHMASPYKGGIHSRGCIFKGVNQKSGFNIFLDVALHAHIKIVSSGASKPTLSRT